MLNVRLAGGRMGNGRSPGWMRSGTELNQFLIIILSL